MTDPTEPPECQCPQCGRLHRALGFGAPPAFAQLMKFYGVSTVAELVAAQDRHIAKMQERLHFGVELPPQTNGRTTDVH